MRRGLSSVVALLLIPAALGAQGLDDSDGAVLAQPPDPRPRVSLGSIFSPPPAAPAAPAAAVDPVVHPAPANPLPPAAHAPMPRVELSAYPAAERPIRDRKAYSLWKGREAPLPLPPERVGILAADGRVNDAVAAKPAGMPPDAAEQTFINVEVRLKDGGDLRDAVADLAGGAGFRADMRFPATLTVGSPRSASLWGWIPTGNLGAAAQIPSVLRLTSSAGARAQAGSAVSSMLIGLRVPEGFDPSVSVAAARAELAADAGLVWRRTIGYQAVPGSRDLAIIGLADVPVRSLSRVLAHPSVLKIAPAPAASPADAAIPDFVRDGEPRPAPAPSGSAIGRFLRYVASESPILLVITALLFLPPLTKAAKRLARLL